MNKTLGNVLAFVAGAAAGSAVTWKLLDTKYNKLAQEEIASVKEYYASKYAEDDEKVEPEDEEETQVEETVEEEDLTETMNEIIAEQGYVEEEGDEEEMMKEPYVISPDDFGDTDYETITLVYYADGVLADTMDNVIEDVEDVVGNEALAHFDEYEDDTVCVRNDREEVDYEIIRDYGKFSDLVKMED